MAFNWAKILPIILQLLTLLFGGTALANGTAISYGGEAADTALSQFLMWGGGASAVVTTAWGRWLDWRNAQGLTGGRSIEIAALAALSSTTSARGDDHGLQMIGQLSKHLSKPNAPKIAPEDEQPQRWRPIGDILQELVNTMAHQNAVTIEATSPRL